MPAEKDERERGERNQCIDATDKNRTFASTKLGESTNLSDIYTKAHQPRWSKQKDEIKNHQTNVVYIKYHRSVFRWSLWFFSLTFVGNVWQWYLALSWLIPLAVFRLFISLALFRRDAKKHIVHTAMVKIYSNSYSQENSVVGSYISTTQSTDMLENERTKT